MKRLILLSFALLLSSISLAAQSTQPPRSFGTAGMEGLGATGTWTVNLPPEFAGCPVSLRAQQAAGGEKVEVGQQQRPKGPGQGLHLVLASPDGQQIVGATVTVRGLTPKIRATRTPAGLFNRSDASRTIEVPLTEKNGKEVSGYLWIPGLTAVQTIDLVSATFWDGTTFKVPAGANCRTRPDPVMFVSGR